MPLLDQHAGIYIIRLVDMREELGKGQEGRGRKKDRKSLAEVGGRAREKEREIENPGGRYITAYLKAILLI